MSNNAAKALEQGKGILRLAPTWVPRSFCVPGRRIKLHPDDYYVLGGVRGGIDERWLSSTTPAKNGPLTGENEGLSAVVYSEGGKEEQILLIGKYVNYERAFFYYLKISFCFYIY